MGAFSKQVTSKRENMENKNAKVAAAFVVAFVAPGAILTAAGFTSTGVAGGSIASAIHASIGVVKANSIFAACQSFGATGVPLLAKLGIGFTAAAATSAATD